MNIPEGFARISIPQAHRTINHLAQAGEVLKMAHPTEAGIELVFVLQKVEAVIIDCNSGCAWADPKVLV